MAFDITQPVATDSLATSQPKIAANFSHLQTMLGGATPVSTNDRAVFTGEVRMFSGTAATKPTGWLVCDGSAVSRTTYSALFAVIASRYGDGNGTTTFNLPNMASYFPIGVADGTGTGSAGSMSGSTDGHTLTTAEIPAHTHTIPRYRQAGGSYSLYGDGAYGDTIDSGSIGGSGSHTHTLTAAVPTPANVKFIFLIKY